MDDSLIQRLQDAEDRFNAVDSRLSEIGYNIPQELTGYASSQLDRLTRKNASFDRIQQEMSRISSHPMINPQSTSGQIHPSLRFIDPAQSWVEQRGDRRREMVPLIDSLRQSMGESFDTHVQTGLTDNFGHPVIRVRYDAQPDKDRPEMYRDIKTTSSGAVLFGEPNTNRPSAITSSMSTDKVYQRYTAEYLASDEGKRLLQKNPNIKPGDIKTHKKRKMTEIGPGSYRTQGENLGAVARNPWAIFSYDYGGKPTPDQQGLVDWRGQHGGAVDIDLFEANPAYIAKRAINAVSLPEKVATGGGMNGETVLMLAERAEAYRNQYQLYRPGNKRGMEADSPSNLGYRKAVDGTLYDANITMQSSIASFGGNKTMGVKGNKHLLLTHGGGRGQGNRVMEDGVYRPLSTPLGQFGGMPMPTGSLVQTAHFDSRFGFPEGGGYTPDVGLMLERMRNQFVPGIRPEEMNTNIGDMYIAGQHPLGPVERGSNLHFGAKEVGDTGLIFGNYQQHKIHNMVWDDVRGGTDVTIGSQLDFDMAEQKQWNKKDVLQRTRHQYNPLFKAIAENYDGARPDSVVVSPDIGNKAAGNSLMMWAQQAALDPREHSRSSRGEAMIRQLYQAGNDAYGASLQEMAHVLGADGRRVGDLRMVEDQIRAFDARGRDMDLSMSDLFESDAFRVQINDAAGMVAAHEAAYQYVQQNKKKVQVRDHVIDHWQIANVAQEHGRKRGSKDGDWGELSAAEQQARAQEYGKEWVNTRFDRLQFIPHNKDDARHSKFKSGERWNDEFTYKTEESGYWIADYEDKANVWYTMENILPTASSGEKKSKMEELSVLAAGDGFGAEFLMDQDQRGAFNNKAREMISFLRDTTAFAPELAEDAIRRKYGNSPVNIRNVNFSEINRRVREEMDPHNFTGSGESSNSQTQFAQDRAVSNIEDERRKAYAKKLEPLIRTKVLKEINKETGGAPLYYEDAEGHNHYFPSAGVASSFMETKVEGRNKKNNRGYGDIMYMMMALSAPIADQEAQAGLAGGGDPMSPERIQDIQKGMLDPIVKGMKKEVRNILGSGSTNERARSIHAASLGGAVSGVPGLEDSAAVVKSSDAINVINQYKLSDDERVSALSALSSEQMMAEVFMYPQANRDVASMAVRWLTENQVQERAGMEHVLAPRGGIGMSPRMVALFAKDNDGDQAASVPVLGRHASPQRMILDNHMASERAWRSRGKEQTDIVGKVLKNSPEAFAKPFDWDIHKMLTSQDLAAQGKGGAASQSRMGKDYDAWVRTFGDMPEMVKGAIPQDAFKQLKVATSLFGSDVYQLSLDMDQSQDKNTMLLQDMMYDGRIASGGGNTPGYGWGPNPQHLSDRRAYHKGRLAHTFGRFRSDQEMDYAKTLLSSMVKANMAHRDPNQIDRENYGSDAEYEKARAKAIDESRNLYLGSDHMAADADRQFDMGIVDSHARTLLPIGQAADDKAVGRMSSYLRSQFDTVMGGGDVDIKGFFEAMGQKYTGDASIKDYVFGRKDQEDTDRSIMAMTMNAKVGQNTIVALGTKHFKGSKYEIGDLLPGRMKDEAKRFGRQLYSRRNIKNLQKAQPDGVNHQNVDDDIEEQIKMMGPSYSGFHHMSNMLNQGPARTSFRRQLSPSQQISAAPQQAMRPSIDDETSGVLSDIHRDIFAGRTPTGTDVQGFSDGGDTKRPGEPYKMNVVGENGPEIIMGGDNWIIPHDIYNDLAGATKGWVARQEGVSVSMPGSENTQMPELAGQERVVKKDLLAARAMQQERRFQATVDNAPEISFGKPAVKSNRPPAPSQSAPPPLPSIQELESTFGGEQPPIFFPDGTNFDRMGVRLKETPPLTNDNGEIILTEEEQEFLEKIQKPRLSDDGVVQESEEQHIAAQTRVRANAAQMVRDYPRIAENLKKWGHQELGSMVQDTYDRVLSSGPENSPNFGDLAQTHLAVGQDAIAQHPEAEMFRTIHTDVQNERDLVALSKGLKPNRVSMATVRSTEKALGAIEGFIQQYEKDNNVVNDAAWVEAFNKQVGEAQSLGHSFSSQRGLFSDSRIGTRQATDAMLNLTGDASGNAQEKATYSAFQQKMGDAGEILSMGTEALINKELDRSLPKLDAGTLNTVMGKTTGIENLTKEVKDIQKIFNETADITKMSADATKSYGQRLKQNVKIYEELDHVQKNLERRASMGLADKSEQKALAQFQNPKVQEFMNTMRGEYDSATQRVAYADTMRARNPMSDVERQDRLRALLERRGPGGNAAREAGKADLLYEGGLDFMGRKLKGKQIDRLGAGMRMMGAAQSGLFTASMLRFNLGQPLGNAMGEYFQREMARDQSLVASGGMGYGDFMSGEMGQRRRRFAQMQQFMPNIGEQMYGAYEGIFDFAMSDKGARSLGSLASVAAPAIGLGMMTRSMTSSGIRGLQAGIGAAALAGGNYIYQGANNAELIADFRRNQANQGTAEQILSTIADPLNAASVVAGQIFNTEAYQEGSVLAEIGTLYEGAYQGNWSPNVERGNDDSLDKYASYIMHVGGVENLPQHIYGARMNWREGSGTRNSIEQSMRSVARRGNADDVEELEHFTGIAPDWEFLTDEQRLMADPDYNTGPVAINQFFERSIERAESRYNWNALNWEDKAKVLGRDLDTDQYRMQVAGVRQQEYLALAQDRGISEPEALQEYTYFQQNDIATTDQLPYTEALDRARIAGVNSALPGAQQIAATAMGAAVGSDRMADLTQYVIGGLDMQDEGKMSRYFDSLMQSAGLAGQQRQAGMILGDRNMANNYEAFALGGQFEFGGDTLAQQIYSGAQSTAAGSALQSSGFGQYNNNMLANQFMGSQAAQVAQGDVYTALRDQRRYGEVGSLYSQYKANGAGAVALANVQSATMDLIGRDDYSTIRNALNGDQFAASLLTDRGMIDYGMIDTSTGHSSIQYGISQQQHSQMQNFMAETGRSDLLGSHDMMSGGLSGMQYQIRNLQRRLMAAQAGTQMAQINMSMMSTMGGATGLDNQGFAVGGDGLAGLAGLFASRGMSFNAGTGMGMWQIQDRMTQISREKQDWQMQRQGENLDLSGRDKDMQIRHFLEKWNLGKEKFDYNTGFQRESMQIARSQQLTSQDWQREDFAFQQNKADVNFGWQMEDYDRNIRFARGRQRLDLIRQKNRAVISQSMDQGQRDRSEERFETQTEWSDEKFEREKEHFEQNVKFQEEEMEMSKRHFLERMALEDEKLDRAKEDHEKQKAWLEEERALEDQKRLLERQTWELQMTMQRDMAGMSAATNEAVADLNESMAAAQEWLADMGSKLGVAVRDGTLFADILERVNLEIPDLEGSFSFLADQFPAVANIAGSIGNIMDIIKGVVNGVGAVTGVIPVNPEPETGQAQSDTAGATSRSVQNSMTLATGRVGLEPSAPSQNTPINNKEQQTLEQILVVLERIAKNPAIVNAEIHTNQSTVNMKDVFNAFSSRTDL